MQTFCAQQDIPFYRPIVDYIDFQRIVNAMLSHRDPCAGQGYDVIVGL